MDEVLSLMSLTASLNEQYKEGQLRLFDSKTFQK